MSHQRAKRILIIAGPNGAGKTTFAHEFLVRETHIPAFVNADLIASGLNPLGAAPRAGEAGRLMLREIHDRARRGENFAFETTLSGRAALRWIRRWRGSGYEVVLYFLKLASVELAISRVRKRVEQGGHDVPDPILRRRFERGWHNFLECYRHAVNSWVLYDNSGRSPRLVTEAVAPPASRGTE